jgi:hypothetical protein
MTDMTEWNRAYTEANTAALTSYKAYSLPDLAAAKRALCDTSQLVNYPDLPSQGRLDGTIAAVDTLMERIAR